MVAHHCIRVLIWNQRLKHWVQIKIYKEDGKGLGDGILSFQKQESVAIALDMLNDGYLRQDS